NTLAVSAGAAVLSEAARAEQQAAALPLSCNQYSWITFYARDGKDWGKDPDASLAEFASTGLKAYEPAFNHAEEVPKLLPVLAKHRLAMPSVYVNTALHEAAEGAKSIESVLSIADAL